jgi:hypothetical protein
MKLWIPFYLILLVHLQSVFAAPCGRLGAFLRGDSFHFTRKRFIAIMNGFQNFMRFNSCRGIKFLNNSRRFCFWFYGIISKKAPKVTVKQPSNRLSRQLKMMFRKL